VIKKIINYNNVDKKSNERNKNNTKKKINTINYYITLYIYNKTSVENSDGKYARKINKYKCVITKISFEKRHNIINNWV